MQIDILTLFPEIFSSYLEQSLLGKALTKRLVTIARHDLRNWATNRHQRVDDRPYGGGPGMILMVEPVVAAVEAIQTGGGQPGELVLLTPQGARLSQPIVEELARQPRLVLLCGRYEGFDERIIDILNPRQISVGDYVLNGGEVAAMVVIDAVIRLVPGVLGHELSSHDDSFSSGNRGIEYPQYTRPREFRGHAVPEVLMNGNHQEVESWRREQSALRTKLNRKHVNHE
ncbi:MAG TPA: tRNA (guanosine(37)-N1)-methyltransferase TrmD [Pirellulaceae bacterium]|nr:tRNA (guanosine(37)-N1)-methyltransferase TrmD [Pirellulaceae bacterium]